MKPFLITGGCGFVGRNLAKRLLSKGNEVWIIDNLFTGRLPEEWLGADYKKQKFSKGISLYKDKKSQLYFINADIVNFFIDEVRDTGKSILPKFSDAYHFASVVGGRELIEGDPLLVSKDLAIDSYFFLWASRFLKKHQRILYASSSAIYPVSLQKTNGNVLKESDVNFKTSLKMPDMTYGWSKLTGEYLARIANKKYGINVACVRPFSGYGEDQEPVYPIPAIARRVARKENPLSVWGTGKQGRDFVHIDDCIEAFFITLDNISDGSAVNIGSGKLTTFLEVLEIFSSIAGYNPRIKKLIDKPVGVAKRYSNSNKLKRMGWKLKVSMEDGFRRVFNHVESQKI